MRLSALSFARKTVFAVACAAMLAIVSPSAKAQDDDPPAEAGRISGISGTVSIQPVGSDDWGQAYANLPIGEGDRIFTDSDGRVEIQVGQTYVRIGPNSDVTLTTDRENSLTFGIAQGSVHFQSIERWPRQTLHAATPSADGEILGPGEFRVDVQPNDQTAIFSPLRGSMWIIGAGGFRQEMEPGQSLELVGSNPVYPQWLQPAYPDDLDSWSQQRDRQVMNAVSYRYVSREVTGAGELDAYGDWQPESEYGAIWFPRNVPGDWAPYHYGHWVNHAPWGWVWVEDESWGYAPFHYGRWVNYRGRWGWIPGAPAEHPVWSPALVVFAGGVHVGGVGVSVWFPLGPGEAYRPWYPCSPRYVDRVNITNIRESSSVHVQNTYVNVVNVTNITYVNQTSGATAMRHEDFASGRSAHNVAVAVDVRQMQHVQPLAKPEAVPTQQAIISRPVAHPVRVSTERPKIINGDGKLVAAKPGAAAVEPPAKPAPQIKPVPGRTVIAPPPGATPAAHAAPMSPGVKPGVQQPVPPAGKPAAPVAAPPAVNQPVQPTAPMRPQPGVRPAVPPANRPITPPEVKPATPETPQPGVRPAEPPVARPTTPPARPQVEPVPPPAARPTPPQPNRPEIRPEAPPVPPATARPAPPPPNRPETRPETRPEPPAAARPAPPPPNKPEARPETRPEPPAAARPAPPPTNRPGAAPATPPAAKPAPPPEKGKKPDEKKKDQKPQPNDQKPNGN